jgi:Rap1a immunity proteins
MRGLIFLSALAGFLSAATPAANAPDPVSSMTVAQFVAGCQGDHEMCADGVLSGIVLSCYPGKLSTSALADRVVAWLKDHPAWSGRAAYDGVTAAGKALWPCK